MIIFNQDVINNLFYILLSIFLIFFLVEKKTVIGWYSKLVTTLSFSLAIIFCMLSPIYQNPYCVHDLRMIPFVLGIMYGGPFTGFGLLVVLLASRTMLYGWSFVAFVIYVVMFIVTIALMRWFKFAAMTSRQKIIFSVILFTIHSINSALIAKYLTVFFIDQNYVINFILLPSLGMLIITYICETLVKQIHMNRALVKMEKIEVLGQLAASISHEVKNPLTVMKGFLKLLNEKNIPLEKKEQYINITLSELNRAEEIIHDYLAFANPNSEQLEEISVEEQLSKVIDLLEPIILQHSVSIKKGLEPGLIKGNTRSFQQAFLNIIKNALESMPQGGDLLVTSLVQQNKVIIAIRDNGKGMSPEETCRLGEPYFSTKETGTGLGLMISYRIIEAMKGKISVESQIGKGTTFFIEFVEARENSSS
ncbi:ATP-binding protein [Rossellomorea aquimaris]|uniref:ATP-binding protein n=1 Tax=Rossellomorea aquimaris TaxID=189382 RepID=UPI0007D085DE|nr:ATP-binding protein [Rossellomorea aquimaris]